MCVPIPGHWRRMYGALYVVDDLDAYLENPESYLAAHPLEIKDALLKDRRPRTEWKFDDLAGGRRRAEGRTAPTAAASRSSQWPIASPATRWTASATTFGPELTKLDDKMHAARRAQGVARPLGPDQREVSVLSSSSWRTAKVVTGLVLEETPETNQGDRESAGQGRGRGAQAIGRRQPQEARIRRSCPRACSTSCRATRSWT